MGCDERGSVLFRWGRFWRALADADGVHVALSESDEALEIDIAKAYQDIQKRYQVCSREWLDAMIHLSAVCHMAFRELDDNRLYEFPPVVHWKRES